jgi:subtilisin family serine protease
MALTGTQSLTGTSVSTAAVSAVAAVLWAYRPELPAWNMMQGVYASGVSLDPDVRTQNLVRAEYCVGNTGCNTMPIRRVSVCGALNAACASGRCDAYVCNMQHPAYVDFRTTLSADASLAVESFYGTVFAEAVSSDESGVSDAVEISMVSNPESVFENHHTQPWVLSQPGVGPCPYCAVQIDRTAGVLVANADMSVAIDGAWVGTLTKPTLEITTNVGKKYFSLTSASMQGLTAGAEAEVLVGNVVLPSQLQINQVSLLFAQEGTTSLSVRQDMLFWEKWL